MCECCYLGLTPDDVGRVKVHGSMWRDKMMTLSAYVRKNGCNGSTDENRSAGKWNDLSRYVAISVIIIIVCPSGGKKRGRGK